MNDLVLHGIVGALIAATPIKAEHAMALVVVAAVAKKAYDWHRGGVFGRRDILATVGGGLPVLILRWEW